MSSIFSVQIRFYMVSCQRTFVHHLSIYSVAVIQNDVVVDSMIAYVIDDQQEISRIFQIPNFNRVIT